MYTPWIIIKFKLNNISILRLFWSWKRFNLATPTACYVIISLWDKLHNVIIVIRLLNMYQNDLYLHPICSQMTIIRRIL